MPLRDLDREQMRLLPPSSLPALPEKTTKPKIRNLPTLTFHHPPGLIYSRCRTPRPFGARPMCRMLGGVAMNGKVIVELIFNSHRLDPSVIPRSPPPRRLRFKHHQ